MTQKGKTTDGLMRHIRDNHHISIGGSKEKKELLEMGYYHGYKAYRFLRTVSNPFSITSFEKIKSVYDFDTELKAALYSSVMQLEMVLKNYTIAIIVSNNDPDLDTVFKLCLNRYKEYDVGSRKYRDEVRQNLLLKQTFDSVIARNYVDKAVIQHYVHNNKPVPLWAIFELITLGDYGNFLLRLNTNTRLGLEEKIGIKDLSIDTDGSMLARHVFIIKELRNAIAHNSIIFDCRFKKIGIRKTITEQLKCKVGIDSVTFNTIVDYLLLIVYYEKSLGESEAKIHLLINNVRAIIKDFEISSDKQTFNRILGTDVYNKLNKIDEYI